MLGRVVYWIAVLAISLVLVVLLILWFESRDASQLEDSRATATALEHEGAKARPIVGPRSGCALEGAQPQRFS